MEYDTRPKEIIVKEAIGEETPEFRALVDKKDALEKQLLELRKQVKDTCPHPGSHVTVYSKKRENDRMWYWEFRMECELCGATIKKWHN